MSETVLKADAKEIASETFAEVVHATANNFPDPAYRPKNLRASRLNALYGFTPVIHRPEIEDQEEIEGIVHSYSANSDGTGTKPEFAERRSEDGNYTPFEDPAFDVVAMVADDVAREGAFVVGIINCLDVNSAKDLEFIAALSRGMEKACNTLRAPLINGETAELGYRTPGWGKNRLNWNAVALKVVNMDKLITGEKLRAGQIVVAFREKSIRSNGLTDARAIIELAYLNQVLATNDRQEGIAKLIRQQVAHLTEEDIIRVIDAIPGGNAWEGIQLPWHRKFPDLTRQLASPSTIFAPVIYEAQGGINGEVNIPLIAGANISGGGVPTKGQRMVEKQGLGLRLDAVFDDPAGVPELMQMAQIHGYTKKGKPFTERVASETWNRSVGFISVVETQTHADELVALAASMGREAAIAGEITDRRVIEWRGEKWEY